MARHSIRKDNVRFVINKEKRTVVCVLEGTEEMFSNFMAENAPNLYLSWKIVDKAMMPDRFVGKAVCSVDDEWDEEKGKLLAYDRMKRQLNKAFFSAAKRVMNEYNKVLDDFADVINAYGEKLYHNAERRKYKLEELIGKED